MPTNKLNVIFGFMREANDDNISSTENYQLDKPVFYEIILDNRMSVSL